MKIKLFDSHFAWIYEDLLNKFDSICPSSSRTAWIKGSISTEFGIILKGKSDLLLLDSLVKKSYYLDKTDWLREQMRKEIKQQSYIERGDGFEV